MMRSAILITKLLTKGGPQRECLPRKAYCTVLAYVFCGVPVEEDLYTIFQPMRITEVEATEGEALRKRSSGSIHDSFANPGTSSLTIFRVAKKVRCFWWGCEKNCLSFFVTRVLE